MNTMLDYIIGYLKSQCCEIPSDLRRYCTIGELVAYDNLVANFKCYDYEFSFRYYPDKDAWRESVIFDDEIFSVYEDDEFNMSIELIKR